MIEIIVADRIGNASFSGLSTLLCYVSAHQSLFRQSIIARGLVLRSSLEFQQLIMGQLP